MFIHYPKSQKMEKKIWEMLYVFTLLFKQKNENPQTGLLCFLKKFAPKSKRKLLKNLFQNNFIQAEVYLSGTMCAKYA